MKPYLENRGDRLMMHDLASLHSLIAKEIDNTRERSPWEGKRL